MQTIKKTILLILLLLFSNLLVAQILKGKVIDISTKQPISDATISIISQNLSEKADKNGVFTFSNLSIGRYSVKISSIGYEDSYLNEILLSTGKETEITVNMTEAFRQLDELIVKKEFGKPQNDMATVSAKSITIEQTKRYAATWGDPARMALSFAGTSNVNDETNEIVIRGNSPKGMLWKIEGVEVPNPSHFSNEGAAGGGLLAISTNVIGNSEFYTGAFPAEYGNATSGIFDLHLRKGNSDKRETTIQAGFQGLEIGTEGPFSKKSKASYLINYRYSTLGFFKAVGLIPLSYLGIPKFQDICFKVHIPLKKYTLSIWGLGGKSHFDYDETPGNILNEKSDLFASGINLFKYVNKNAFWENILSFSGNQVNNSQSFISTNYSYDAIRETNYSSIRYSTLFNQKINSQHNLRAGFIATNLSFNLLNKFISEESKIDYTTLNDSGNSQYLQGFLQWKNRIKNNFTLNTGLHSTFFILNNTYSIEPRIGAKYQLSSKSNLSFGYGVHSRLEPLSRYLSGGALQPNGDKYFPNKNLEIPKSIHYVLGYEIRPNKHWRLNSEIYLQNNSNYGISNNDSGIYRNYSLINEIDVDMLNMPSLTSSGKGQNFGIEFTAEKFLTDGWYFLSTTSIFNSTFTNFKGESYTARFSNNFVQNFLAGKEWVFKGNSILSFNLRTNYSGGVRVVPIDLDKTKESGYEVRNYSTIYNHKQLADFFRTDLKISYIKNSKKVTSTFSLDLNNITNHKNPRGIYYDYSTKTVKTYYQLGFIPVFNYRLEF